MPTKRYFRKKQFFACKTLQEKLDYAEKNCVFIGKGSTRIVYRVRKSSYVLKIALNEKGIAQNQAEVEVWTQIHEKSPLITNIRDFANDYSWIESQIVKPLNDKEFEKLMGFSWYLFEDAIIEAQQNSCWRKEISTRRDVWKRRKRTKLVNQADAILTSSFVDNVINMIEDNKLNPGDIKEVYHWGKTTDQRVVLLDYGLTADVVKKHYGT